MLVAFKCMENRSMRALLVLLALLTTTAAYGANPVLQPVDGGTGSPLGVGAPPYTTTGNGATTATSSADRFGQELNLKADFGAKFDAQGVYARRGHRQFEGFYLGQRHVHPRRLQDWFRLHGRDRQNY